MASIRLNKDDRQDIIHTAMARSEIVKKIEEHEATGRSLAEEVRVHLVGGKNKANQLEELDRQFQALRDKVPEDLLQSNICLLSYRRHIRVVWEHSVEVLDLGEYRICPSHYQHRIEGNPELAQRVVDFFETRKKLQRERNKLRATLDACMKTATTTKKLLTMWPEAEALLPPHLLEVTKTKPTLPALQTKELNKALNLVPTAAKKEV